MMHPQTQFWNPEKECQQAYKRLGIVRQSTEGEVRARSGQPQSDSARACHVRIFSNAKNKNKNSLSYLSKVEE